MNPQFVRDHQMGRFHPLIETQGLLLLFAQGRALPLPFELDSLSDNDMRLITANIKKKSKENIKLARQTRATLASHKHRSRQTRRC